MATNYSLGKDKMISTIAIIGLGQMGASYAKYASMLASKVICYDHDEYQRVTFIDRILNDKNPFDIYKASHINTDNIHILDDLKLIWLQKPVLTIIATHKDTHCYYSCLSMSNDSHVLTEKPLCLNLNETRKIEGMSSITQKKLFIGFSLHATPAFAKLKEVINNKQKELKQYQVVRIGAVPEDYMDRVSARFDLLSHDTDFCLQLFNFPLHTVVEEMGARACNKQWKYKGFQVEMIGRMPLTHPNGFEYGYKLIYQDNSSIEFSSNNLRQLIVKDNKQKITEIIPLEIMSSCKIILEKIIYSIKNDDYERYLSHELSIINGVNCMNMLIHDHESGLND